MLNVAVKTPHSHDRGSHILDMIWAILFNLLHNFEAA